MITGCLLVCDGDVKGRCHQHKTADFYTELIGQLSESLEGFNVFYVFEFLMFLLF